MIHQAFLRGSLAGPEITLGVTEPSWRGSPVGRSRGGPRAEGSPAPIRRREIRAEPSAVEETLADPRAGVGRRPPSTLTSRDNRPGFRPASDRRLPGPIAQDPSVARVWALSGRGWPGGLPWRSGCPPGGPGGVEAQVHCWLVPPWQVQMRRPGAVGGGVAGHVEALVRADRGEGAVGVEDPLLVVLSVAVQMSTALPSAVPPPFTSRHLLPYTRSSFELVVVQRWLVWPLQSQICTSAPLAVDAPLTSRQRPRADASQRAARAARRRRGR